MNVGIPCERKPFEFRVGLPPAGVSVLIQNQHTVYVESCAGTGAGFTDEEYEKAGARIVYTREEVYGRSSLILKFSQPLREELPLLQDNQTLAGFLHLAAARRDIVQVLMDRKMTAIAYEQIEDDSGIRPVLKPLSQIGGRMVVQVATRLLQNNHGGRGILLGGLVGVPAAEVVIIGAGVLGSTAAQTFAAMGAHVTILDSDMDQLQKVHSLIHHPIVTMLATRTNLRSTSETADVLLGAVLNPGERAPIVVTRDMVARMKPHSVIIDMSIDQGGCIETSRPTSHDNPTFLEENVIHYCVPNISGVLGHTASTALYNGIYPHLVNLARWGIEPTIEKDQILARGINLLNGEIVHLNRLGGIQGLNE